MRFPPKSDSNGGNGVALLQPVAAGAQWNNTERFYRYSGAGPLVAPWTVPTVATSPSGNVAKPWTAVANLGRAGPFAGADFFALQKTSSKYGKISAFFQGSSTEVPGVVMGFNDAALSGDCMVLRVQLLSGGGGTSPWRVLQLYGGAEHSIANGNLAGGVGVDQYRVELSYLQSTGKYRSRITSNNGSQVLLDRTDSPIAGHIPTGVYHGIYNHQPAGSGSLTVNCQEFHGWSWNLQ